MIMMVVKLILKHSIAISIELASNGNTIQIADGNYVNDKTLSIFKG